MNVNAQATPNATVSHAAYVACQAARAALRNGATTNMARLAYDRAYADALRG